jgi:predicted solute-binding protein
VTRVVRLGAVSYLNTRPLVYGLDAPDDETPVSVMFDVPAVCAERLAAGQIDLGLVPSITYLDRPDDRIVPGVAIASDGPVASVAIFTRRPMKQIRRLALDTSSRTSAVLTRILCARVFGIAPEFVRHAPDLPAMLGDSDAALVIGDPALFMDAAALGVEKIDLGQAWTALTNLPFVWAFWSGAPGAASPDVVRRLQQAKVDGLSHSDEVADAFVGHDAGRRLIARRYLRENMRYDLSDRMIAGLEAYYREAAALGLATPAAPRFFGE